MTISAVVLLVLLACATIAFASDRIPADIIALVFLLAMIFLGYVTPAEAFAGFSSDAMVILIAAFVFTGALTRSGLSQKIGQTLLAVSAGKRGLLRGAILTTSAMFSLVINNVAATAVLLPGVTEALRRRRIPPSKVLLPVATASQLGGMATLLTTSNIVASEVLRQRGFEPFGLMDFLPVGGPLALIGLAYLYFVGPRLLPRTSSMHKRLLGGKQPRSLARIYELRRRLQSARIRPASPLVGATLGASGIAQILGSVVIAVVHPDGSQRRAPEPALKLEAGDVLVLDGVPSGQDVLDAVGLEPIRMKKPTRYLASPRVGLVEAVVTPRSRFAGKTLKQLSFRENHGGVSVLSIYRDGAFVEGAIGDVALKFGDALLLQGPRSALRALRPEGDLILIGQEDLEQAPRTEKTPRAMIILIATLVAAVILPSSTAIVLFSGAVAMLLFRCLQTEEAYRAIDWKSVVMIAGMLPLGIALGRTGAAEQLGDFMVAHIGGELGLLVFFTFATVILTQLLPGGAAPALVMVPIAISVAVRVGADPRVFAMAVALATSTSMLTPFSHPVNLFVMGPGGYQFRDYARLGLPLVIVLAFGIVGLLAIRG
ncbi:MAG TPA: SLC13 family permease [Thermoanaerobaculia bacterium]|nr:SLC13 family permease [Thermoanaerobaculia bacterium]